MAFEIELKFPLESHEQLVQKLIELQAEPTGTVEQQDTYFNHPSRDFAQTDEAVRIRISGSQCFITYKGPNVDTRSKSRREIEIPFGSEETDAHRFQELLGLLGFRKVRTVTKTRQTYRLSWEDRQVELAIDDVEQLGCFLEIETIVDEPAREAARDSILRLADQIGLHNSMRRSYLGLLLDKDRE